RRPTPSSTGSWVRWDRRFSHSTVSPGPREAGRAPARPAPCRARGSRVVHNRAAPDRAAGEGPLAERLGLSYRACLPRRLAPVAGLLPLGDGDRLAAGWAAGLGAGPPGVSRQGPSEGRYDPADGAAARRRRGGAVVRVRAPWAVGPGSVRRLRHPAPLFDRRLP